MKVYDMVWNLFERPNVDEYFRKIQMERKDFCSDDLFNMVKIRP